MATITFNDRTGQFVVSDHARCVEHVRATFDEAVALAGGKHLCPICRGAGWHPEHGVWDLSCWHCNPAGAKLPALGCRVGELVPFISIFEHKARKSEERGTHLRADLPKWEQDHLLRGELSADLRRWEYDVLRAHGAYIPQIERTPSDSSDVSRVWAMALVTGLGLVLFSYLL